MKKYQIIVKYFLADAFNGEKIVQYIYCEIQIRIEKKPRDESL